VYVSGPFITAYLYLYSLRRALCPFYRKLYTRVNFLVESLKIFDEKILVTFGVVVRSFWSRMAFDVLGLPMFLLSFGGRSSTYNNNNNNKVKSGGLIASVVGRLLPVAFVNNNNTYHNYHHHHRFDFDVLYYGLYQPFLRFSIYFHLRFGNDVVGTAPSLKSIPH